MNQLLIDLIPEEEYDYQIRLYANKSYQGQSPSKVLENSSRALELFFDSLAEEKINFRYAANKWTVGEVIQHIITYEKIFIDRINLVLDKGADLEVPFYTQASTASPAKGKTKQDLIEEFRASREHLSKIIAELDTTTLKKIGQIDGFKASIRAMVACASGHQQHHLNVIRKRYL